MIRNWGRCLDLEAWRLKAIDKVASGVAKELGPLIIK